MSEQAIEHATRTDPVGTVRQHDDGTTAVKVSMGDDTGKGQHVWCWMGPDLEVRWLHHHEVSEWPQADPEKSDAFAELEGAFATVCAERDALLPRLAELAEQAGKLRTAEWLRTCALLPPEEWPPAPAYKGPMVPAADLDVALWLYAEAAHDLDTDGTLRRVRVALGTPDGRAVSVHAAEVVAERDQAFAVARQFEARADTISRCSCDNDGIECDHEAARGTAELERDALQVRLDAALAVLDEPVPHLRRTDPGLMGMNARRNQEELMQRVRAALQGDQPTDIDHEVPHA